MSTVSPPTADGPKTLADRIRSNAAILIRESDKPKEDRQATELARAATALQQDAAAVADAISNAETETERLEQLLAKIRATLGKEEVAHRHSRGSEARRDLLRLVAVWGIALWAWVAAGSGPGWLAVGAVDLYLVLVVVVAAIRSDEVYAIRDQRFRQWLYEVMPSRLVAPVFVAGLFCALWWGFAALFQPPLEFHEARQLSFVTLATFSGPDDTIPAELHSLIRYELGSAILLVICIFSMLINRISEF